MTVIVHVHCMDEHVFGKVTRLGASEDFDFIKRVCEYSITLNDGALGHSNQSVVFGLVVVWSAEVCQSVTLCQ